MNPNEQDFPKTTELPGRAEAFDGDENENGYEEAVAVVGMAGRFPGAADVAELWRAQLAGVPGLRRVTEAERAAAGVREGPGYVPVAGPVPGLEEFDAQAFGLTEREARTLEPHHRLLLECSWEALESAGRPPVRPGLPVGLFAGCAFPDYLTRHVPDLAHEPDGARLLAAGVERDSLTSLVSWRLGLSGPSLTVQSYCSTSLVAVHLACQSLLTFECDLALAGGAHLPLPQGGGYRWEEGGILSPEGRAASLDASADGTVMSSGAAVVALRRLSDALADGDPVHAVILGSAVNNDGPDRAGYAAPGVVGQAAVIETAQAVAGVKPESVGYLECHAVGTPLGDSIEVDAVGRVFSGARETPCVLGSAKPLIGHLDRAAGVTGLIRAALALRDRVLPATAGFRSPNPALAAAADRLTVLTENRPWPEGPEPRRAGVSSFGVGGTNAHVVLEEPPAGEVGDVAAPRPGPHLLTLSAADPAALDALTGRLRDQLARHPETDLADLAHTLQVSRGALPLRRAVVVRDHADALVALADPDRWWDARGGLRPPSVGVTGRGGPALDAAVRRLWGAPGLADGLARLGVRIAEGAAEEIDADAGDAAADPAWWLTETLARLWLAGARPDWAALHGGRGRRLPLPTYPFQRARHWIEPVATAPDGDTWAPAWRRLRPPTHDLDRRLRQAGPWLLLVADPAGEALADRLLRAGAETAVVRPGETFQALPDGDFTVGGAADLARLPGALVGVVRRVVYGFALADDARDHPAALAALVGALGEDALFSATELVAFTSGALGVLGPDLVRPEHAALGAEFGAHQVDLAPDADPEQALAAALAPEAGPLAVRGPGIWAAVREPVTLPEGAGANGRSVLLVGSDEAVERRLVAAGALLTPVAEPSPAALDAAVRTALARHGRLDAAVLVRPTPAELDAVQGALGELAGLARVVITPSETVAAAARAARHGGAGRWLAAGGEAAGGAVDRLLAAAGHLEQVTVDRPPAAAAPAVPPAGRARPVSARPEAPDERAVAELWCLALGCEEVGLDDNFFDLGGRSAGAVLLAERLGAAFGVRLPATVVLEHPTVRRLTDHLAGLEAD
ncbi:type I polyketide synthase [Streptomyces sp. NBRC 109706]|uniref:type I polyketide synthase n=1 Tax=Streptomyces sp. NBRC 109706 TaxID=1550035 RepID=UPI0007823747|nr:type I polyketide synthase [Streptomyces sp. NBRC 109706]